MRAMMFSSFGAFGPDLQIQMVCGGGGGGAVRAVKARRNWGASLHRSCHQDGVSDIDA
jgi:hypothetical protein